MKRLDIVKEQLKPGAVYHRADLLHWSTSVDRDLQELMKEGCLEKLSGGLYNVPSHSVFGKVPADEQKLANLF